MTKMLKLAACLAAVAWCGQAARADIEIAVGTHALLPNTPGQIVQIYVTGDTAVQGVQVDCQIADGGPLGNGKQVGPAITDLDLISGTIFAGNNTDQEGPPFGVIIPQVATGGTTTASGTVPASGLLATITIDTTGFFTVGESWDLRLTNTLNGNTMFGDLSPTITNGTITLSDSVPEPAAILLFACGAPVLLLRRRRLCPRRPA